MTSSDAETDFKPIIIIIKYYYLNTEGRWVVRIQSAHGIRAGEF